jgi:hypothetical protein
MNEVAELSPWQKIAYPFAKALDRAFGCRHENLSRVFTMAGRTYRVCCDCGADFNYCLDKMEIVAVNNSQGPLHHLCTRHT